MSVTPRPPVGPFIAIMVTILAIILVIWFALHQAAVAVWR